MSIMEALYREQYNAVGDRNPVVGWAFSPEGWDKVRLEADMNAMYVNPQTGRIETVLGVPYRIDTDLDAGTDFRAIRENKERG